MKSRQTMARGLLIFSAAFALFCLGRTAGVLLLHKPQPRIEVSTSTYDFGPIQVGQPVEHVFQLRNVGRARLIIRELSSSCVVDPIFWTAC
jgi:uncharacterized protein (DUF58 family)